jgi:hypothetical protein
MKLLDFLRSSSRRTWTIEEHTGGVPGITVTLPNFYSVSIIWHKDIVGGPYETALLFARDWAFDDVFRFATREQVLKFVVEAAKLPYIVEGSGLRELDRFGTQFKE